MRDAKGRWKLGKKIKIKAYETGTGQKKRLKALSEK